MTALDPLCNYKDNCTLLHNAAKNGQLEELKSLFKKGILEKSTTLTLRGVQYFHTAASHGHINIIDCFLEKLGDVNETDWDGWTMLHHAAKENKLHVVDHLFRKKANIYASSVDGKKALHVAASYGHDMVVSFFLLAGMHVENADKNNLTALLYAAQNGSEDLVKLLLFEGASLYARSDRGLNAIHYAAKNGHTRIVEIFLNKKVGVDDCSDQFWTPLHYAALGGHFELVQFLVDNKANIHARTSSGVKAIHIAALNGHKKIVEYFLCRGISVDEYTDRIWTPLHICLQKSEIEFVEFLVQKNANINAKTDEGASPLHLAAKFGRTDLVKYFLDMGCDVNVSCKINWTALDYAAFSGSMDSINYILEKYVVWDKTSDHIGRALRISAMEGHLCAVKFFVGFKVDLNLFCPYGNTLLFYAAKRGHLEIVKYLCENGANHVGNYRGVKPIHVAAENGYKLVVEYFLNEGVCIEDADENGWTPLHYAVKNIHLDLVKYLINRGSNINARSRYGASALCIASLYRSRKARFNNCLNGFQNLYKKQEDFFKFCNRVKKNHSEMMDFLIENGGLINDDCCDGWTPLHFAFHNLDGYNVDNIINNVDYIIKKLISAGVDLDKQNNEGETPLHIASKVCNLNAIKILLDAEPNLHIRDENGDTPLHVACKNRNYEAMILFLEAGAKSDIKNNDGRTVCFYCMNDSDRLTMGKWKQLSRILEKISVFTDIDDREKKSALHLGVENNCDYMLLELVLGLQFEVNVLDVKGNTCLNLVSEKLSVWPVPMSFLTVKLFIYNGAYFNNKDCERIISNGHFRDTFFNDVDLCSKSVFNRLNNEYLPKIYNSFLAENLPPIDRLKTCISDPMEIRKSVEIEISNRGFCDMSHMMLPLVLLSVICLANHC